MNIIRAIVKTLARMVGLNTFYVSPDLSGGDNEFRHEIALDLRRIGLRLAECPEGPAKILGVEALDAAHVLAERIFNIFDMFDYVATHQGNATVFNEDKPVIFLSHVDDITIHQNGCDCKYCAERRANEVG